MRQKKPSWKHGSSIFWMPLLLGVVMFAVVFGLLTVNDLFAARETMDETMDFAALRVGQYTKAMDNDQIKSEIRLLDKTFELSRRIEHPEDLNAEVLDFYAYNQRLTGAMVLDADLNVVCETTGDGSTMAYLQHLVDASTVREILQYPVKSYMTRTEINGEMVDFAAVARRDAKGLVIAYTHMEEVDEGDWQLSTLFEGCVFEKDGVVVVGDGETIIATNMPMMLGMPTADLLEQLTSRTEGGNEYLSIDYAGTSWRGQQMAYESYNIFVFFPHQALFRLRNSMMGYGTLTYMTLWLCFIMLRLRAARKQMEQHNEQLQLISSISDIYSFTALMDITKGTMRIIKHPSPRIMQEATTREWDMRQSIPRAVETEVSPDFHEEFLTFLDMHTVASRLEGNTKLSMEYQDQHGRTLLTTLIPQSRGPKGQLTTVLLVMQDVTEEKQRELEYQRELKKTAEEAKRASVAKTDFLRRMSHDIRTPINGIRGMVDISRHYQGNEQKQEECREKITVASSFLLNLVSDVLNMNKLESGEIVLESKPVNLREMVEEVITLVEGQAWENNIQVSLGQMQLPHEDLLASPLHLRQVLQNIVGNAVKYNKKGGSVHISCRELSCDGENATVEFVCADTGRGMSAEFQAHAFEAFAQEDISARTTYKGTGLGLAIVKELVERMKGDIHFTSQQGVGTTFYLTLTMPLDPNPPKKAVEAVAGHKASIQGMHVLLVEDNALNMEISEFVLTENGAEITKAWNGAEAVEAFHSNPPGTFDCILMDMMMPVMGGEEATRTIRASDRPDGATIPILAMTANAFSEDEQRSLRAGMNRFLTKPIDEEKMLAAIAECVAIHRAQRGQEE